MRQGAGCYCWVLMLEKKRAERETRPAPFTTPEKLQRRTTTTTTTVLLPSAEVRGSEDESFIFNSPISEDDFPEHTILLSTTTTVRSGTTVRAALLELNTSTR